MAKSKFHEENPEAFTEYNRERTKKYRWEHPDKVRQFKENQKKRDAEYRKEHAKEKNKKQNELNAETLKNATNNGKWSDEELEQLKQMVLEGKSYTQIATELKRSYRSVSWAKQKYFPNLITEYKKVHYIPTEENN